MKKFRLAHQFYRGIRWFLGLIAKSSPYATRAVHWLLSSLTSWLWRDLLLNFFSFVRSFFIFLEPMQKISSPLLLKFLNGEKPLYLFLSKSPFSRISLFLLKIFFLSLKKLVLCHLQPDISGCLFLFHHKPMSSANS